MIVYFLRHANAGERMLSPKKDEKRGLDKEGIEQCGYVGRWPLSMCKSMPSFPVP
jgi:phosphohistidine phosphatase